MTEQIIEVLKGDQKKFFLNAHEFFENVDDEDMLKTNNIINKKPYNGKKISLRFIEWVVTKYARKNLTKIDINNKYSKINDFYIYSNYRSYLRLIHTSLIAPFKRKSTKFIYTCKGYTFNTTVCQLQFMKWIIMNDILTFIDENYELLKNSKNDVNDYFKKKKDSTPLMSSDSNNSENVSPKIKLTKNDLIVYL